MPRFVFHHFVAAFFLAITLFSFIALAGKIVCPVCGQAFSDDEKICPNDGTDLSIVGKIDDSPYGETDNQINPYDEKTEKNKAEPNEQDDFADKHDSDSSLDEEDQESGKYKRQDQGGKRIRLDGQEDGANYNDRRQRIGEDSNKLDTAAEKRKKAKKKRLLFKAKDDKLRREFERRKQKLIQNRKRRANADKMAKKGFEELLKQSLWAQAAPLSSMGLRLSWMGDAYSSGPLAGPEIEINLLKNRARLGLSTFVGIRSLKTRGDLVFLQSVAIGIQKPWRYSPYVLARAGVGALLSNRFGADITYLMRTLGVETGADCRISKSFVITPSVGYIRFAVNDVHWNSVTIKLTTGF